MKDTIYILVGSTYQRYEILKYGNIDKIIIEGTVVIDIEKYHNHRYEFQCFFYNSKRIYTSSKLKSKRELIGAIQNLLSYELHVDVQ